VRGLAGSAVVEIAMRDKAGAPVQGLDIAARLEFMPDSRRDIALTMTEAAPGLYRSEIKAGDGIWLLQMAASRQGEVLYRSRNHLSLR
jgi:nitrogen fixation protein FixH